MPQRDLAQWLEYQQSVHARGVDLGLARVREVWRRMGEPRAAPVVITVGGTNGKGSSVAFLEAMLAAAGRRVGAYTSPHLLRYNERIRINRLDVDDNALIAAFERIEAARLAPGAEAVPLTYFEFGTLAALWIFAQSTLDVALLEVGLGGRLDAVNIVDADVAIVTTIALDHQDWLGDDLDSIAREKAGIFRAGRPAIIGDAAAPVALAAAAERIGAQVVRAGTHFQAIERAHGWTWRRAGRELELPDPQLAAPVQRANAAAAIAALDVLRERIPIDDAALAAGVRAAGAMARLQRWVKPGAADLVIDVAHNPQAAQVLAHWLGATAWPGRNLAVFGALSDKDVAGIVAPLAPHVSEWFLGGLDADTPRGLAAADLAARASAGATLAQRTVHPTLADALDAAADGARSGDRILAFGSFFVAAAALAWAARNGYAPQVRQGERDTAAGLAAAN